MDNATKQILENNAQTVWLSTMPTSDIETQINTLNETMRDIHNVLASLCDLTREFKEEYNRKARSDQVKGKQWRK
jgi:hypothetical protein